MKLLDRVAAVGKRRRLATGTIQTYQEWIAKFLRFCRCQDGRWRQPGELGAAEVGAFLTYLASERRLAASSQNQATCAIVFLYKHILADELGDNHLGRFEFERSRRPLRTPTVLSAMEAARIKRFWHMQT
jgi:site-specific recombinase XerD